jgi:hypothetical protein
MIGVLGFDFRLGLGIFLFITASRMALGPTQPPIQWVLGIKRPGREADHSPPSSAEVNECVELYLRFPNTSSWRGAQFKEKHRDNFTFILYCWNNTKYDSHCWPLTTGQGSRSFKLMTFRIWTHETHGLSTDTYLSCYVINKELSVKWSSVTKIVSACFSAD